jgi:hypothetical protein
MKTKLQKKVTRHQVKEETRLLKVINQRKQHQQYQQKEHQLKVVQDEDENYISYITNEYVSIHQE